MPIPKTDTGMLSIGSEQNVKSKKLDALIRDEDGTVFVEYLLLLTIVGIGVIAGLATLRGALTSELIDLANAIASIS